MKLTTKQLRQIIKEELGRVIREGTGMPKLDMLLQSDDGSFVIQGIELADVFGISPTYADLNRDAGAIRMVIAHPTIKQSPEAMRIFATAPPSNAYVLGKVARNPITPVDVLEDLMDYSDKLRVKRSLAINTASTNKMLSTLAKEHDLVKQNVATNPSASPETLDYLVNYGIERGKPTIVSSALQNPSVSNETLMSVVQNSKMENPRETATSTLQARGERVPEQIKPEPSEFDKMFGDPDFY